MVSEYLVTKTVQETHLCFFKGRYRISNVFFNLQSPPLREFMYHQINHTLTLKNWHCSGTGWEGGIKDFLEVVKAQIPSANYGNDSFYMKCNSGLNAFRLQMNSMKIFSKIVAFLKHVKWEDFPRNNCSIKTGIFSLWVSF